MSIRRLLKIGAAFAAAVVVACAVAWAWFQYAPREVPADQPPLVTIEGNSLAAVRDAFNAGQGEVRVLALLSPT